jgi:hypothetical protein
MKIESDEWLFEHAKYKPLKNKWIIRERKTMKFNGINHICLALLLVICVSGVAGAQIGMRYLTPNEFPKYDQMLKNYGRSDLKTTVAVVDTVNNQERILMKCVNKKGAQYTVWITDGKIVTIKKIKPLSEADRKKFIEDTAREMTNQGMTPPKRGR